MACVLVVAARNLQVLLKGDPVEVFQLPRDAPWGNMEGLPDFIRITLTDADKSQVTQYLFDWVVDFEWTIQSQNAAGWRFRVEVDPQYVSASGTGRDILRQEMEDWVAEPYEAQGAGGTVVTISASQLVADIPKTGLGAAEDLAKRAELKSRFSDKFRDTVLPRRYYFASSDVDTVIGNGGLQDLTRAQAIALLIDRLTE